MSHVKRSQLLAFPVKLIFCGLYPPPFFFLQNMGDIIYNSHTSDRWNSVLHPSPKKWLSQIYVHHVAVLPKRVLLRNSREASKLRTVMQTPLSEYTYFYFVKKYFKKFSEITSYMVLNRHASYTLEGSTTNSLTIYFIHLRNKDIYSTRSQLDFPQYTTYFTLIYI